ncbi:hypothetical protein [Methylocystis echinoides]|jgi:hypothetical protein|uniref:hypothetical protein n=1 Tax=Methylocystis echinoides TaxID=29468 RepID=UPI00342C03E0
MKKVLIITALAASSVFAAMPDAGAVVCARGVYRAGCAGPNGAVGVRRGFYGPAYGGAVYRGPYGGGAVVRGPYGGAVYRRW